MPYYKIKCRYCNKSCLIKKEHLGQQVVCPTCKFKPTPEMKDVLELIGKAWGDIPVAEPEEECKE